MPSPLFDINDDGADYGYEASASEALSFKLRSATTGVSRVLFQVYSAAAFVPGLPIEQNPPRASPGAPELTLDNGAGSTGQAVQAATPVSAVTTTAPSSGVHSWTVRCVLNGGQSIGPDGKPRFDPSLIHERGLYIPLTPSTMVRKIIATEKTQFGLDGWVEAINTLLLGGGGGGFTGAGSLIDHRMLRADGNSGIQGSGIDVSDTDILDWLSQDPRLRRNGADVFRADANSTRLQHLLAILDLIEIGGANISIVALPNSQPTARVKPADNASGDGTHGEYEGGDSTGSNGDGGDASLTPGSKHGTGTDGSAGFKNAARQWRGRYNPVTGETEIGDMTSGGWFGEDGASNYLTNRTGATPAAKTGATRIWPRANYVDEVQADGTIRRRGTATLSKNTQPVQTLYTFAAADFPSCTFSGHYTVSATDSTDHTSYDLWGGELVGSKPDSGSESGTIQIQELSDVGVGSQAGNSTLSLASGNLVQVAQGDDTQRHYVFEYDIAIYPASVAGSGGGG